MLLKISIALLSVPVCQMLRNMPQMPKHAVVQGYVAWAWVTINLFV